MVEEVELLESFKDEVSWLFCLFCDGDGNDDLSQIDRSDILRLP